MLRSDLSPLPVVSLAGSRRGGIRAKPDAFAFAQQAFGCNAEGSEQ